MNSYRPNNYLTEKFLYPQQINTGTKIMEKYCHESSFVHLNKKYVALDLEMSDLKPETGKIIQLAYVPIKYLDNQIIIYPAIYTNVYAENVSEKILYLTKIKKDDLQQADTIDKILRLLPLKNIHYIGHHIISDLSFLYYNLKRTGLKLYDSQFSDSFYLSNKNLSRQRHHDLKTLKENYQIYGQMHNAYNDAVSSAIIYYYLQTNVAPEKVIPIYLNAEKMSRKKNRINLRKD